MDRESAQAWVKELFAAWEAGEPSRAAALFSPDAVYRSHPFGEPHRGRAAISAYWGAAVERQDRVEARVGAPVVDGDRVAVEWWASVQEGGAEAASTGTLFLRFDEGGRCTSLREVWMERPGRAVPYDGWGS